MTLQYDFFKTWLTAQARSERGAALVEYALLVALIAVVCIGAVTFLGGSAKNKFSSVGTSLG
ncbi:MAG: Flp family type IVb pilin [Actinomycetes bacterium]